MATIQGVYLALFGRPADPLGLSFFNSVTNNGQNLAGIGPLQSSAEFQTRFSGQTNTQIITSIYRSLFNRDPDLAGLTFFSNALATGTLSINNIAIAILDGAQGADVTIRDLKLAAANAFTTAIDTVAEINGYSGTAAAQSGAAFIATVTTTAPTAAQIDAAVAAASGNGEAIGTTFTLTDKVDAFVGTNNADTFNAVLDATAANGTLQLTDSINGGAGTDTLNVRVNGNVALDATKAPVLTGIEVVSITELTNAQAFDASIAPSLTTINQVNSLFGVTANNVAITTSKLGLSGTAANNADFTVNYKAGLTGASDALTINVSNNSAADTTTAANFAELKVVGAAAGDGWDLVTVNSTGAATRLDVFSVFDSAASTLKTLTITGDGGFRVNTALEFLGTSGPLDSSKASGAINLAFGAEDITVTGGSGNDRFNFAGTLTSADKVDGGAGTDTVAINQTINAGSSTLNGVINKLTSIETLELTQAAAALDASQITLTKAFSFSGGGNTAVTGTANDQSFAFTAAAGATTFAPAIDGGADVLNLSLSGVTVTSVGAGSYETVNIAAGGTTGTNAITTLTVNTNGKAVITGARDFTTTVVGTNATLDGSAATGKLTLTGEAGNNTITGGTADDRITGAAGIDTIDLSKGGQDTVNLAGIVAGTNRDIVSGFTAGANGDILDIDLIGATAVVRNVTGTSTGYTFTNTDDVVSFNFNASTNSANLSKAGVVDGTELFKAIANEGSTIASITTTAADQGYILATQGGNTYLYFYDAGAADTTLVASEVQLIGVLNGVAAGALVAANFA